MKKKLIVIYVIFMILLIPMSSALVIRTDLTDRPDIDRGWVFLSGFIYKPEIKDGVVDCLAIRLSFTYVNIFSGGTTGACSLTRVTFEEGPIMGKIGLVRYVCRVYFGNFTVHWGDNPFY